MESPRQIPSQHTTGRSKDLAIRGPRSNLTQRDACPEEIPTAPLQIGKTTKEEMGTRTDPPKSWTERETEPMTEQRRSLHREVSDGESEHDSPTISKHPWEIDEISPSCLSPELRESRPLLKLFSRDYQDFNHHPSRLPEFPESE